MEANLPTTTHKANLQPFCRTFHQIAFSQPEPKQTMIHSTELPGTSTLKASKNRGERCLGRYKQI